MHAAARATTTAKQRYTDKKKNDTVPHNIVQTQNKTILYNRNKNKSALYGHIEKRYSKTQTIEIQRNTDTQKTMYNKNNTALYGHTKRCYTDTHKLNQLKQYIVKHIIKQITTHKSIQYQTHKNDTVQHGFIQTHTSMIYACTVQNSVIQTYTR